MQERSIICVSHTLQMMLELVPQGVKLLHELVCGANQLLLELSGLLSCRLF